MASFVYEIRFLDVNEQYLVLNFFFSLGWMWEEGLL